MARPFLSPPPGGHLLGQPCTLANLSLPVNATLTCNCGASDDTTMHVVASAPVQCPGCHKVYVLSFNPANGQVAVQMADVATIEEPS